MQQKDLAYRPNGECDGVELEGDVVKEILTFVDIMTSEGTDVAEVTAKVKQDLVAVDMVMETETKEEDNVLQMVRQLNHVGTGSREQCKLIIDLTYELESLDCGQYVVEEPGTWWVTATAQGPPTVPTLVQEEGQPGILLAMMHSSTVPVQEPQGEADEGIQIW